MKFSNPLEDNVLWQSLCLLFYDRTVTSGLSVGGRVQQWIDEPEKFQPLGTGKTAGPR